MAEERKQPDSAERPKVRSARAIRTIVLCALAAAPAACGPSQNTGPQQPQPSTDAGAEPTPAPAYGVPEPVAYYAVPEPYEPGQPMVSEYAVVAPPDRGDPGPAAEYLAPMPTPD